MSLTNGTITQTSVSSNSAVLAISTATSGTDPYVSYQWYRSTTTGFSVGPTNILTGQVAQTLSDTGLVPNTTYFYKNVVTDSASPAATNTSAQFSLVTLPQVMSQNALIQSVIPGQPDLQYNYDTISCQIDVSAGTTLAYQGQAMKIVANTQGGIPRVVPCTGNSDNVFGFISYDVKSQSFGVGSNVELASAGNVIWLYSTTAITQGAQVCLDALTTAGVQATGNSATFVGVALDGAAAAGALIRVHLRCPSFATA